MTSKLPDPFLFRLDDVVVVKGRDIYMPVPDPPNGKSLKFIIGGAEYSLILFPKGVSTLEQLYFEQYSEQIGAIQKGIVQQYNFIGSMSDGEVKRSMLEAKLLQFIIGEVFPSFLGTRSSDSRIDDLLLPTKTKSSKASSKSATSASILDEILGSASAVIRKVEPAISRVPEQKSPVLDSVMDFDFMVFEGSVYKLVRAGNEKIKLVFDSVAYGMQFVSPIDKLKERYMSALLQSLKEDAIKNSPEIARYVRLREEIVSQSKSTEYRKFGLSIVKLNDYGTRYRIDLDVPEFVNAGEDGYFLFPATKVGLVVAIDENGNIAYSESPIVVGKYSSPFLSGSNGSDQQLCTNKYVSPSNLSGPDRVVDYLNTARQTLMSGYFGRVGPYHPLNKEEFGKFLISNKDMESRGLKPINQR